MAHWSLGARFFTTLTFLTLCWGAIYEKVSDLPQLNYDFVIIGGGTAGNVLANRLTENPKFSVLVLEAGVSNQDVFDSEVPFLVSGLLGATPYNWNFTTVPQQGINGRSIAYPRGHILGGSSSVNGMFYTRGSSDDFDRFADVSGDPGWSWDSVQPYIRKNERWTAPADHHDTRGQFDPAVHSTSGINFVSLSGFPQPIDGRVIETTVQLKDEFPFNLDMNSGRPLGVGWIQATIGAGTRSSSATSYLGPNFIHRPNLHILLLARVTRLIQTGSNHSQPSFKEVEFAQDVDGPRFVAQASKEVILSAGTIMTPHILLHSGIGDEAALNTLGIKPLHDLPSVGQNLTDQPFVGNTWFVNSTDTFETFTRNATLFNELIGLWNRTHTGPLVDPSPNHLIWLRLPSNSSIFKDFKDPAAGPNTPHIELSVANGIGLAATPPTGNFLSMGAVTVTPVARGSIKLNTTNPFDQPLIDLGLLDNEFDMFGLRTAIKRAERFLSAPAWKDYIIRPMDDLANAKTDAELDEYIRNKAFSTLHPVGTSSMSAKGAKHGVVDPDLRVKGITGLRVVDASIMPFVTCGHTQAPTYIIAERAADLIKETWA